MILTRDASGRAALVENGCEILHLSPGDDPAGFALALARIEAALCGTALPRLVVVYREGLFAEAAGDLPAEVVLVEEDPHDDPPRTIRRQRVAGEASAVDAVLARVGQQGSKARGAA